jgi:hypothetical protein
MTASMVGPTTIGVLFPEFQISRGDLLSSGIADGQEDPGALYQSAYDLSGVLNARMSQLRAATRLARRWCDRGDGDLAAGILAPLYSTFEEGFGTADLAEAREILATVAPDQLTSR